MRFSPNGKFIASASDGGLVIIWRQDHSKAGIRQSKLFGEESDDEDGPADPHTENWAVFHHFRASDLEDVYDLCWSPDSRFVLFGLTDHSIQIWDTTSGQRVKTAKEHCHFVQGVAWDPLNVFLGTQSSDRSVRFWKIQAKVNGSIKMSNHGKVQRAPVSFFGAEPVMASDGTEKQHSMFFDETLVSFFRRLAFSPDGSLVFMPTGTVPQAFGGRHAFYISTRGQLSGLPGIAVDGFTRGIIAIRPHPRLFKHSGEPKSMLFTLPYRIVYATASQDTVCIFDSTQLHPIAVFTNLHYGTLTDLAWSTDGHHLIATATDGFASLIRIEQGELGEMMSAEEQEIIIESLREKYAPGAIPIPKSQSEPLDLALNLNSEPAPISEMDPIPSSPQVPQVVNILPVKRKVVPSTASSLATNVINDLS